MRDPSAKFSTCGAPICKAGSADPASPLSWLVQKDIAGAGTLGDIASHVIDIAQYLAGDIEAVTGMMQTYITERPVQESGTDLLGTVKLGADASGGRRRG